MTVCIFTPYSYTKRDKKNFPGIREWKAEKKNETQISS